MVREIGSPMPIPSGLVGEKWIEDVREFLGGDAFSGIADRDLDGSRGVHSCAHGYALTLPALRLSGSPCHSE